jgi:UDP-4-amino-4,6-dideoxy-L-N-acetyl-beta-L-altrosamine transaminase
MEFLPYSKQLIDKDDIEAVIETLNSNYLTTGPKTKEFEDALSKYLGCKYVSTLNSATSALLASYVAIGLKKGDEVITTPISFVATSNMLIHLEVKPIFIDIRFDGNIDERQIEKAITEKTKAVVSVDYSGNSANVKAIRDICDRHNLKFISDSSHALGSEVDGIKVGNFADATIFSFHAIKPITTFEGGAIATDSKEIIDIVNLYKSHGIVKKRLWNSDMVSFGHNFRLSDVASSLGLSQLKKLDKFIESRDKIASYYDERFKNNPFFTTLQKNSLNKSSHHLYPILLDRSFWCSKEEIFSKLIDRKIGVQVHYKPIHTNTFYKNIFGDLRFPVAEEFYRAELSIPNHQGMNLDDAKYVADNLFDVLEKKKTCRL